MRWALGLAYDGAGTPGWQTQSSGLALQDRLEASLSMLVGHAVHTVCAGRTDAGVHALGQVVHFDTVVERPVQAWVRGVNARLPETMAVLWARQVDSGFHARFGAIARSYRYLLRSSSVRDPLWRNRAGWVFRSLDLDAMCKGALSLVGEHDFTAFRSAQCQAATPVRRLTRLDIEARGEWVQFTLSANAFLHHMVRNIVGALVYVGSGRQPAEWIGELLVSRRRALAAPTFSPAGLYLCGVDYDASFGLPTGLADPLVGIPPTLDRDR